MQRLSVSWTLSICGSTNGHAPTVVIRFFKQQNSINRQGNILAVSSKQAGITADSDTQRPSFKTAKARRADILQKNGGQLNPRRCPNGRHRTSNDTAEVFRGTPDYNMPALRAFLVIAKPPRGIFIVLHF